MAGEEERKLTTLYVNLKDHFDALWLERKEQLALHFSMLRESLLKYENVISERLKELNNLRKEYTEDRAKDQSNYVTRTEYKGKVDGIDKWITDANDKFTKLMTKYETRMTAPVLIAVLALLVSVIGVIVVLMKH